MDEKVAVIIISRNELEKLKLCVDSIRSFADVDDYSIIIADNDSDDGTVEWAEKQDDIAVYEIKDEIMPWGKVINSIIKEIASDAHIMVLEARCAITPGTMSGMFSMMSECSAVVTCINHSNDILTNPSVSIANFSDALNYSRENKEITEVENVMGMHTAGVLFNKSLFSKVGYFDERISTLKYLYIDYSIRMLELSYEILVVKDRVIFEMDEEAIPNVLIEVDKAILRGKYGMNYFNMSSNHNIVEILVKDAKERNVPDVKVLEIGCDLGATLFAIKQRIKNSEIYGTELNRSAAKIAGYIATVKKNNIEDENLDYEEDYFDYIVFGDVLEHLHDPEKALKYVRRFLKKDGRIIASIPNLMHISVIKELLKGNFEYQNDGLLDRTHIHFFTFNEIVKMIQRIGFKEYSISSTGSKLSNEDEEFVNVLLKLQPEAREFMYSSFQYLINVGNN